MTNKLKPADKAYGWVFGCDGLITKKQAAAFLSVHPNTIDKLAGEGKIRRSKNGDSQQSPVRICKRSVVEYAASLEE